MSAIYRVISRPNICKAGTPGDNCGDDHRRDHGDHGSQEEDQFVRLGRGQFFLEYQFDGIGDGLQNTPRTGAVRANARSGCGRAPCARKASGRQSRPAGSAPARTPLISHSRTRSKVHAMPSFTLTGTRRFLQFGNDRHCRPATPCCAAPAPRWREPSRPTQPAPATPLIFNRSPGWMPRDLAALGMQDDGGLTDVLPEQFRGDDRDAAVVEARHRDRQPLVFVRAAGLSPAALTQPGMGAGASGPECTPRPCLFS